jgi:hypothetical protein
MHRHALLLPGFLLLSSCTGTTGYNLVYFYAAAEGPADAQPGYTFTNDLVSGPGFQVSLSKAVLHVGAIYLDESVPTSGGGESPCTLPGTYVGEVRPPMGLDADMLSPNLQRIPVDGFGSTIPAAVGQVWLGGPDVNAASDPTVVLDIAGTATRLSDGLSFPFEESQITISASHDVAASQPTPGAHPICGQRIVTPIRVDITLSQAGTLILHLDPRGLFTNVDFSRLPQIGRDPPTYGFSDNGKMDTDQPSRNLYGNLTTPGSVYGLEWQPAAH